MDNLKNAKTSSKQLGLSVEAQFNHYMDQAASLPFALKKELDLVNRGASYIKLYAQIDLDKNFHIASSWLVLTDNQLIFAEEECRESSWKIKVVEICEIEHVHEVQSLSCMRLSFLNKQDQVLLSINFSHRQSRPISMIRFVVEEQIKSGGQIEEMKKGPDEIYINEMLGPIFEAQASISGSELDVIWRLLGFLKPYRLQVVLGMCAAIAMTAVSLIPPYLTGYLIDQVVRPSEVGVIDKTAAIRLMWITIFGLIATYITKELFGWIRLRTMSVLGEYVARDLRNKVYSHLHRLSLNFFSSKQTGSLISRVGSDTDRIWDFVAFGVVEVTTSMIVLLGLSVVLIRLDLSLGLIVTLPIPFLLWLIYRHGQHMQALFLRAWRKWSDLTDCLSDTIPGIRVVKAFNRQKEETKKFKDRNSAVVGEFNNIHQAWTKFWPGLMLLMHIIVILVWVFGVPRVIGAFESTTLSAGTFVSFVLYLTMFSQPIEVIGQMARMINRATSSAHRVFEVLDTEPQINEDLGSTKLGKMSGQIEFKNVSFSYDGVRKVVKNVSFFVQPGEMIGLVGPSGGGKSTVTNLIARFYETDSGQILIDGHDIKSLDVGEFRQNIGMVLQDPYLFHGTLLENIKYAKPEASLNEIIAAARAANAHDFICRLPNAYDTVVGERGQTLSGGERQRISIARAILRNPRLLILDEATSAVDTETERKIQQALDRLTEGRTVIAIAHRLSTLASADRIFVMKQGELVEMGSHQELMDKGEGLYKKLVSLQSEMAMV